jgi:hypothetical protein
MLTTGRAALTAIVLATSVAAAQAQTTTPQDHAAHHPQTQGTDQTNAPPAMPMGQPGAGMPEMMGGGMSEMMGMMQRMMGGMGMGESPMSATEGETGQMGQMAEMMQSMGRMMGAMGRMMEGRGMGMMAEQAFMPNEQRLALLKSRLNITEAQMPQWNAFADALQSGAGKVRAAYAEARQAGVPASAPDRTELRVKMLSVVLDSLKATVAAEKSLYAVLTDDQKKIANEALTSSPRMTMGMGL